LVQLKGGKAGISRAEIARLKKAAIDVSPVNRLIAAYDGDTLHLLPAGLETVDSTEWRPQNLKVARLTRF
jgi:hypothetical protein